MKKYYRADIDGFIIKQEHIMAITNPLLFQILKNDIKNSKEKVWCLMEGFSWNNHATGLERSKQDLVASLSIVGTGEVAHHGDWVESYLLMNSPYVDGWRALAKRGEPSQKIHFNLSDDELDIYIPFDITTSLVEALVSVINKTSVVRHVNIIHNGSLNTLRHLFKRMKLTRTIRQRATLLYTTASPQGINKRVRVGCI